MACTGSPSRLVLSLGRDVAICSLGNSVCMFGSDIPAASEWMLMPVPALHFLQLQALIEQGFASGCDVMC